MSKPLRVLSLGAGVQSTTLFLMSCDGVLPKLDHAIFADTGWEPQEVYEHFEWLQERAADAGIPVHVVSAGNIREHSVEGFIGANQSKNQRYATMPLHVLNPDGSRGMVRRQCTREYKIEPIEKKISEIIGRKKGERWPTEPVVDQWFGISADELRRVRMPSQLWKRHIYPLVGLPEPMLERSMTRQGCIEWLRQNYADRHIPRSACIGCPYRDNKSWRWLRDNAPDEWADAVEVDRAIRNANKMDGQAFLHRDTVPLDQAKIDEDADQGQLFRDDDCLGYCGT